MQFESDYRDEPCRHFAPSASVLEAVQQQNCPNQLANFERLCAQLQLIPRLTNFLPFQLQEHDWHHLLALRTAIERLSYLAFLFKRQKLKLKEKQKKEEQRRERIAMAQEDEVGEEGEEVEDVHGIVDQAKEQVEDVHGIVDQAKEQVEDVHGMVDQAKEQVEDVHGMVDEEEDGRIMPENEQNDGGEGEEGEAVGKSSANNDSGRTEIWRNKIVYSPYIVLAERIAASHRYIRSLQLAETPRIAFDCRFLALHTQRGLNLTTLQLQMVLGANRDRYWPWPVYLCNFPSTSSASSSSSSSSSVDDHAAAVVAQRRKHLHTLDSARCVTGEVHAESYTELFPALREADKIVYLSPHASEVLTRVDADACYVIGAIVDRAREPRLPLKASLLVSEEEQLPCRRLPIPPEFLRGGNRMLTLVQVLAILQHVYHSPAGDDWHGAFSQHIPKRKRLAPAEKNTVMQLRYENIRKRNNEVARIVEQRLPTVAAAEDGEETDKNGRSDQQRPIGMRFLSRIFG